MFSDGIFADPAWDIMLDLFAADLEQRRVSVSSACLAAAVPPTTALRWLKKLEEEQLIQRSIDPLDRRRVYLSLRTEVKEKLDGWVRDALF